MHFVNGNHWEPVLLRSSVKMQWSPISQRHKQLWNEINPGHDQKTFWRYLHIKKAVDQDSTASSLEKRRQASPILILDESDCDSDIGGDHHDHGAIVCPHCLTRLPSPLPPAVQEQYDEYTQKEEKHKKQEERRIKGLSTSRRRRFDEAQLETQTSSLF
ncbi:hypothetical protein BDB00DRAFT_26462 [Zychaea mexicana]|uniref:uncharacterized protein n=1 Tax=Zychaea mexicana TaxID=64656 RepID=UPI0022FE6F4F|nr:uncharacterized protein BDB00DRAFT_26462 [Zychaea mexicana]KAI9488868.1 hypothetical protein BDB00DRAFT_26462 [Zychaea mexicana]